MVRLANFAAINQDRSAEQAGVAQQTLEAQEVRIIQEYELALRETQSNNSQAAEAAFHNVLNDQLVKDGATEQLQRLRFLSLKNLAGVVATAPPRAHEALHLYSLAASEDASDVALWDRYGTLAAHCGEWAASKYAFEEALSRDPRHPTVSSKLLQVLEHIGDTHRAGAFAHMCLESDPWHPLARRVLRTAATAPATATDTTAAATGAALLTLPPLQQQQQQAQDSTESFLQSSSSNGITTTTTTVPMEKAAWRHVMRRCTQIILSADPAAVASDIIFTAPLPPPPLPAVDVAVTDGPHVEVSEIIDSTEKQVESEDITADKQGILAATPIAAEREQQQQQQQQQQHDGDGDQEMETAPTTEKEKEQEKEKEKSTPQRRSVRSTKSHHRSYALVNKGIGGGGGTTAADGVPQDQQHGSSGIGDEARDGPFSLLRALATTLAPSTRPDSAQLADRSRNYDKNKTSSSRRTVAASRISAAEEAEEVHRCFFINTGDASPSTSVSALHAARSLVDHWSSPGAAARLSQLPTGTSLALLHLVAALEKHQWRGDGLDAVQCLVLGELFADAVGSAARAVAATAAGGATTATSSSSTTSEFERLGEVWMSRFRAAALLHNTAATGTTASSSTECELRYWWSRGRLHEAASRVIDASGCYHHCAELLLHHLQNNTRDDLQIPHCQIDATISTASITAKLELLQLHDVLRDAEHLQQQGKCKEAANMLAPVLLSCDEKEALMAAVDRRTWLRALHVLHAVAASTEGMEVMVLRCHLRLLRAGLPQTPPHITTLFKNPDVEDKELLTATETQQASIVDPHQLIASGAAADLAHAATFLSNDATFHQLKENTTTTTPSLLHPTELHSLRALIKQNLALVHTCGSLLRPSTVPILVTTATTAATTVVVVGDVNRRSALSTRVSLLRQLMSDAAVVALQLWFLDDGGGAVIRTLGAIDDWASGLAQVLGSVGALVERRGEFPAALVHHLQSVSLQSCSRNEHEGATDVTDDEDIKGSLLCNLHNCFLWLYGLRLPAVDVAFWGGEAAGEAALPACGLRPLASQDAALAVWPFIADHFAAPPTLTTLNKNKSFLERLFALFPALPPPLMAKIDAAWQLVVVDSSAGDVSVAAERERVVQNPMLGVVDSALTTIDENNELNWSKYIPVYSTVFYLQHMLQPHRFIAVAVEESFPGSSFLDPGADAVLAQLCAPLRSDLALNPTQHPDRWSELAQVYHEAAELMLLRAAEDVPTGRWHHSLDMHRRVEKYRRMGHVCTAVHVSLLSEEDEDERANLFEVAASLHYADVANVPPMYNQAQWRPERNDPALLSAAESALHAYQRAAELLPDEWSFKMQIGRCLRRLGRSPAEWLPVMAVACKQALQHHNGLVDPVYTIHAARLKLLKGMNVNIGGGGGADLSDGDFELLSLLSKFCFLPQVCTALRQFASANADNAKLYYQLMWNDGFTAMSWCFEKEKKFYRAPLMLAKLAAAGGDSAAVVAHAAPLFSKPKAPFCIAIGPLQSTLAGEGTQNNKKSKKRGGGGGGGGAAAMAAASVFDSMPETEYCLRPPHKTIGIGLTENHNVFYGRLRKALMLYLTALLRVGASDVLGAAVTFFESSSSSSSSSSSGSSSSSADTRSWLSRPGFEDIRALAKGCYVLSVLSAAVEVCSLEAVTAPPLPSHSLSSGKKKGSPLTAYQMQQRAQAWHQRHLRSTATSPALNLPLTAAAPILSKVYQLWTENTVLPVHHSGGGGGWWGHAVSNPARAALLTLQQQHHHDHQQQEVLLLKNAEAVAALVQQPAISQAAAETYAHLYIHVLAAQGASDTLKALLVPLRKKYRLLTSATVDARRLVILMCTAGVDALRIESAGVIAAATEVCPELNAAAAPLPEQEPINQNGGGGGALSSPPPPPPPPQTNILTLPPKPTPPVSLTPDQQQAVYTAALERSQANAAVAHQNYVASGQVLTPTVIQFMQEQQFGMCLAELTHSAMKQIEDMEVRAWQAQVQMLQAQHAQRVEQSRLAAMSASGVLRLAATAPSTAQEQQILDRVAQMIQKVTAFIKSAPWCADSPPLPSFRAVTAAADDVRLQLLRCYVAVGHIHPGARPRTREQGLKMCDDVVKGHRSSSGSINSSRSGKSGGVNNSTTSSGVNGASGSGAAVGPSPAAKRQKKGDEGGGAPGL